MINQPEAVEFDRPPGRFLVKARCAKKHSDSGRAQSKWYSFGAVSWWKVVCIIPNASIAPSRRQQRREQHECEISCSFINLNWSSGRHPSPVLIPDSSRVLRRYSDKTHQIWGVLTMRIIFNLCRAYNLILRIRKFRQNFDHLVNYDDTPPSWIQIWVGANVFIVTFSCLVSSRLRKAIHANKLWWN